jgi:hypothetical protein
LTQSGASLNLRNKKKKFPIDLAVEDENWSLVKYLTKLSKLVIFNKKIKEKDDRLIEYISKEEDGERKLKIQKKEHIIKNENNVSKNKKNINLKKESSNESSEIKFKAKKNYKSLTLALPQTSTSSSLKKWKKDENTNNSISLSLESINFKRETRQPRDRLVYLEKKKNKNHEDNNNSDFFNDKLNKNIINKSNISLESIMLEDKLQEKLEEKKFNKDFKKKSPLKTKKYDDGKDYYYKKTAHVLGYLKSKISNARTLFCKSLNVTYILTSV